MGECNEGGLASDADLRPPVAAAVASARLLVCRPRHVPAAREGTPSYVMAPLAVHRGARAPIRESRPDLSLREGFRGPRAETNENIVPAVATVSRDADLSLTCPPADAREVRVGTVDIRVEGPAWLACSSRAQRDIGVREGACAGLVVVTIEGVADILPSASSRHLPARLAAEVARGTPPEIGRLIPSWEEGDGDVVAVGARL